MRRTLALSAAVAMLTSVVVPVAGASVANADPALPATSTTRVLAGGGHGWSGPADRAQLDADAAVDAAADGTLLVVSHGDVLRVRPDTDDVVVLARRDPLYGSNVVDVAADPRGGAIVAEPRATVRITATGEQQTLSSLWGTHAVDVGADGVVWAAIGGEIWRLFADGSRAEATSPTTRFQDIRDIAVSPDGSQLYVLEAAPQRYGVYRVDATGVGARVAGNLTSAPMVMDGYATDVSTSEAGSLSTDGASIFLSLPEAKRVVGFPIGGVVRSLTTGACTSDVTVLGGGLALVCVDGDRTRVVRSTRAGVVGARLIGLATDEPWSPDGTRADDAYLGEVMGASPLPDGRPVFVNADGVVREVGAAGTLVTWGRTGCDVTLTGKVAVDGDVAYLASGTTGLCFVRRDGTAGVLPIGVAVRDVEVAADGTLLVADGSGHRVLEVDRATAATSVFATTPGPPEDLALDGADLLVADGGLQAVDADRSVHQRLSGGGVSAVAPVTGGIFVNASSGVTFGQFSLHSDGSLTGYPVDSRRVAQAQATSGRLLLAGGDAVRAVDNVGFTAPAPPAFTATAGAGFITLDFPQGTAVIRAKRGTTAPTDLWDGIDVPGERTLRRIDGAPVVPGEQWTFAAFVVKYGTDPEPPHQSWSRAAVATTAAQVDDVAPPLPFGPLVDASRTAIRVSYADPVVFLDPAGEDVDHSVVRLALGTSPPATPTDGVPLELGGAGPSHAGDIPDPIPGQDYAISIFIVDIQGNWSRWTAVTTLDLTGPAPVTDASATSTDRTVTFSFTPPTDPDLAGVRYVVRRADAAGTAVPGPLTSQSRVTVDGLTMDTDYVVSLWGQDRALNLSTRVDVPIRTTLDTVAPSLSGLVATGGGYRVDATWDPPQDDDLASVTATLVDAVSGARTPAKYLPKSAGGYSWTKLPGGRSWTVEVVATDLDGLTTTSTATATTDPDANGAPAPIALDSIIVTPRTSTSITISFPRPDLADVKGFGYEIRPVGTTTTEPGTIWSLTQASTTSATVTATVNLPSAAAYQLVLHLWDFNNNRATTVIPSVQGAPSATELPWAPRDVVVTSPHDNTLDVAWGIAPGSPPSSSWTLTAVSGPLTRTLTLPGTARLAQFADLEGRRDWVVTVVGASDLGTGTATTAASTAVGDHTPPEPVTGARLLPSYDVQNLGWVNPTAFDLDRVEVWRYGATSAETQLVYRGRGTSAASTGLVAGRSYTYLIRAYDVFGNTAPSPVRLDSRQSSSSLSAPATLRYSSTAVVQGVLVADGRPLAARAVSVFAQKVGTTTWTRVGGSTTTSTGAYSVTVKPLYTTRYRMGYAGSGATGGSYSPTRTMVVTPATSIRANRTSVALRGTVTFSTVVAPNHGGTRIALQRWNGSSWVTLTWRTLSSASAASAVITPSARGYQSYRWCLPAHADHGLGISTALRVRVY